MSRSLAYGLSACFGLVVALDVGKYFILGDWHKDQYIGMHLKLHQTAHEATCKAYNEEIVEHYKTYGPQATFNKIIKDGGKISEKSIFDFSADIYEIATAYLNDEIAEEAHIRVGEEDWRGNKYVEKHTRCPIKVD